MQIKEMIQEFISVFGGSKEGIRVFASPGRVNLIGEHTDYNGGYVFPVAIKMHTTVVVRKRLDNKIFLKASDLDVIVKADIDKLDSYKDIPWGNYQLGVIYTLKKAGYDICGADMLYFDGVPHGGGLSSSAATEVSTALCFATFSNEKNSVNEKPDMIELAKLSQKAEREYVGVNCGIMDQFASSMCKENHAIFLNCRSLNYELVPFNIKDAKILISNTNKKHALGSSKYNERRRECEEGLEILKKYMGEKTCLGEITIDEIEKYKHVIEDKKILKRVSHVISENDRVIKAVDALKNGDINLFGLLMNESHNSLRHSYEVSCDELDIMVEEALKVDGVYGSRMTGAGFGGCTVSIVKADKTEEFIKNVGSNYELKTGIKPSFYVTETGNGGREIIL